MNKQEIYDLLSKLGMIEEDDRLCSEENPDRRSDAEAFEEDTCSDLPSVMNFVDELFFNNDEATIKKFLVCLLFNK